MSARERWHRITAYARASKRAADALRRGGHDAIVVALVAEAHAWGRLPENVRAQVQS